MRNYWQLALLHTIKGICKHIYLNSNHAAFLKRLMLLFEHNAQISDEKIITISLQNDSRWWGWLLKSLQCLHDVIEVLIFKQNVGVSHYTTKMTPLIQILLLRPSIIPQSKSNYIIHIIWSNLTQDYDRKSKFLVN